MLKRHYGSSLRDWLGAAEYILKEGNKKVILCERGVVAPHTHRITSRFLLDLQVVPAAKEMTHLPIIVDPSHATFWRPWVKPMALSAIAAGADGIMIARGDLGVELPAHKVPVLQKKIVNKCRFASKPCIIATQMLESMTNSFSATRAEINDVSNSVFDGADALMLSGETSIGIQPLKVVDTMRKTIKDAEKSMEDFEFKKIKGRVSTKRKVADNICKNAISLPIYPYLKMQEVDYICNAIKEFYVR